MSETESAPFISDPAGSFAEDDRADPASTVGESLDLFGTSQQLMRSIGGGVARFGGVGEYGQQTAEPEAAAPADALQQKYSIPGKLTFDQPLPESVAQSMYAAKREEIAREAAIERRPSGLLAGGARYGAQFLADLIDPVNVAAVLIPGAPEINLGASVVARVGARALQGAAGGAAGMVPLAGLKYAMGRQEQSDYDAYNAIADVAIGAGIGAVLHVGGGALGDWLTSRTRQSQAGRIIQDDPETRASLLRVALSQMAADDPVEVRPMFDPAAMEPGGHAPFPESGSLGGEAVPEPPGHVLDTTTSLAIAPGASPFEHEGGEPQRLVSYLVANGGIKDQGGDVRSSMGGYRGRPGLINHSGNGLDDTALSAWEAGFFPGHSERPSINELLDAIDDDLKGVPRFSHHDDVAVANHHAAVASNAEILRLSAETGIPTTDITRAQFFDRVHDQLTPEDFDRRVGDAETAQDVSYQHWQGEARDWVAHHGSPHDFERFVNGEPVTPHPPTATEVREISPHAGEESHGGFDAERFYGTNQSRTLEDLENAYRQEAIASTARQFNPDDESAGPPAAYPGGVPADGEPRGRGLGAPGREGTQSGDPAADAGPVLDGVLRRAAGDRPQTLADAAADTAVHERPAGLIKLAEQQTQDHEEFFRRAEAAGSLSDEVRAELEGIHQLEAEARNVNEAAMQAAACISRGLAGGLV